MSGSQTHAQHARENAKFGAQFAAQSGQAPNLLMQGFAPPGGGAASAPGPAPVPGQIAGPPGRQMSDIVQQRIKNAFHPQSPDPTNLAAQIQRSNYWVHAYGTLARKPELTMQDVVSTAAQGVKDGKTTVEEASQTLAGLPKNPAQLRGFIVQRFKGAILGSVHLQDMARSVQSAPTAPGA
jgi:hypothetical protein